MSSEVNRFDTLGSVMHRADFGKWVLYSDYRKLRQELALMELSQSTELIKALQENEQLKIENEHLKNYIRSTGLG